MSQGEKFTKTKKIIIVLMDVVFYHLSILLSFYVRYKSDIPLYNYNAYENSVIYILTLFVLLNLLFGVYVFYNKSITDFLYFTIIIQLIMTISIMALTFFGRWFTFPRSVLFISFIFSTITTQNTHPTSVKSFHKLLVASYLKATNVFPTN